MKGYRKVLIAVNGSLNVLRQGLDLASDEKCWVTVLKVLPSYEGDLNLTGIKNIRDVFESGRDEESRAINDAVKDEKALARLRVEEGDITSTIERVAREENCDIIIMGRKKGKGLLSRILGDNVLERITKNAPCPVLVVDA